MERVSFAACGETNDTQLATTGQGSLFGENGNRKAQGHMRNNCSIRQHRKKAAKANQKIAALQVELAHVDSEIEKLAESLIGANNVLLSYVNVKIAELDGRKQELLAQMTELAVEAISPEQVSRISGYLDTWDSVSFDAKRL